MLQNKVLIIGNNHHNTLGLVRSLGRGGMLVFCFVVDSSINKSFVSKSRYIYSFKLMRSYENLLEYLIEKWNVEDRIPVFTTSDEAANFIDLNFNILCKKFYLNNCEGKQGRLSYWMDKTNMLRQAGQSGLLVPKTIVLNIADYRTQLSDKIPYPCIIKPINSSLANKSNFRICQNIQELRKCLDELSKTCKDVLLQEYITRDYEYLVMGIRSSVTNKIIIPGGLHKLRTMKGTSSLGMFSYAYTTEQLEPIIDIKAIEKFLNDISYDGIFSMEFMVCKNKTFFLEINLRNDGTQFCFEGSGVNLPVLWIKNIFKDPILDGEIRLKKNYCMVETNYIKSLKDIPIKRALLEWGKSSIFALFDKRDVTPAYLKILYSFCK